MLDELSEKRRRTLISLDMRVKAALWSPLKEESEPAAVLRFWLDKQGKRLVNGSRVAQTRRVNEMLRDVVDDASLREALDALHLMPLVESLRETNDAFGAAFLKRNDDWARKERPNSPRHPQIGGRSGEAADGHAGVFCRAGRAKRVCGVDRRIGPPACLLP